MALTLTFWLLIHLFIHSFSSRWANHDHLSLKQSNKASNQIVFGALMFVNRVATIAGDEGKPLVLRHL